jgi:hypothetical protein
MNALVKRLSEGEHPITIGDSQHSLVELKKRLEEIGYVFILFPETQGGTNLGVRVDKATTDLSQADFDRGTGTVHVEGSLTLNYVKIRCVADIHLATLHGTGHLISVE